MNTVGAGVSSQITAIETVNSQAFSLTNEVLMRLRQTFEPLLLVGYACDWGFDEMIMRWSEIEDRYEELIQSTTERSIRRVIVFPSLFDASKSIEDVVISGSLKQAVWTLDSKPTQASLPLRGFHSLHQWWIAESTGLAFGLYSLWRIGKDVARATSDEKRQRNEWKLFLGEASRFWSSFQSSLISSLSWEEAALRRVPQMAIEDELSTFEVILGKDAYYFLSSDKFEKRLTKELIREKDKAIQILMSSPLPDSQTKKPGRPGRPRKQPSEFFDENHIFDEWVRAKSAGESRESFCQDKGIELDDFEKLQERVSRRRRRRQARHN